MKKRLFVGSTLLVALMLTIALITSAAATTADAPLIVDTNPAIQVAQNTANSVVGVITNDQSWNRSTGETVETMIAQGSGVVIKEGGYILTNYHVVQSGTSYQVLLPSGEKVEAKLVGADDSTDIAVLKVEDEDGMVPVTIGYPSQMPVGSTVIAIGNPGGEVLANTVTSGVISALERDVSAGNATRDIAYIQHDAAISSGNSGGGLFDVNSRLIGINTLKYAGSVYTSASYEGLGFAIPVDTAYPIAMDLIEYGKVLRPQMGVSVDNNDGPDEPMNNIPPASIEVYSVTPGSPAEEAGIQPYDFITAIDGVRVKTLRELTRELDKRQAGDTVEVTVIRYKNTQSLAASNPTLSGADSGDTNDDSSYTNPFGGYFGNPFGGNYGYGRNYNTRMQQSLGGYDELKLNVTLKVLE